MDPSETCSPEICNLQPHTTVRLKAKKYYQNTSIVIPQGAQVIGAGINKTIIISCGAPSSGRRGFILGNNSYLGHYTWQGLQAHRGNFDAAVGTPGCLQPHNDGYKRDPFVCTGGFIPADGDGAGVQNATVEHVHVRPYQDGDLQWPLSTSAGWFPHTMPWGPRQHTGSHNITLRGIINWGTWADGINFHGGHHNVLIEDCEMSFTGDDPYGLWSVSADAHADSFSCQQNIVLRNNIARHPRAGGKEKEPRFLPKNQSCEPSAAGLNHSSSRTFPDCDCSGVPAENICGIPNKTSGRLNQAICCPHSCFATYAGGSGIQFINNHCEGAFVFLQFDGDYPKTSETKWCGPVSVVGNTVSAMSGQGEGCMLDNSSKRAGRDPSPTNWCHNSPPPWAQGPYPSAPTIGGQCSKDDALLPPPCTDNPTFAECRATPGVGGICYNVSGPTLCLTATQLAESGTELCGGYTNKCTIFG